MSSRAAMKNACLVTWRDKRTYCPWLKQLQNAD